MHTVTIESGPVTVERLDDPEDRPWATVYRLAGRRIEGTVVIEPAFHEPVLSSQPYGIPDEVAYEVIPSALRIYYGRRERHHFPRCSEGTLQVNGVPLVGGVTLDTPDTRFTVRRPDLSGIYEEPAPSGTQAKTRQVIYALAWHHRVSGLAHKKAEDFARRERHMRYDKTDSDIRMIERKIQGLQDRVTHLEKRRHHLQTEDAFEQLLAKRK
ncbi:hypothetical protein ACWDR0_10520 [Streptomyces sp. NPDC003691]